jgi:hypothetical protein
MKHEINIDQLAEILSTKARSANRETIKFYGSEKASFTSRIRFLSQATLVRDLGIPVELITDEEDGKELYTAIKIAGKIWHI